MPNKNDNIKQIRARVDKDVWEGLRAEDDDSDSTLANKMMSVYTSLKEFHSDPLFAVSELLAVASRLKEIDQDPRVAVGICLQAIQTPLVVTALPALDTSEVEEDDYDHLGDAEDF